MKGMKTKIIKEQQGHSVSPDHMSDNLCLTLKHIDVVAKSEWNSGVSQVSPMATSQPILGIQRDEGDPEWPKLTKTEGRHSTAETFHGNLHCH